MAWDMQQLGATFTIHAGGKNETSNKDNGHRIHVLAELRNKLLENLQREEVVAVNQFRKFVYLTYLILRMADRRVQCRLHGERTKRLRAMRRAHVTDRTTSRSALPTSSRSCYRSA